ncbi:ribosome hibernation-promoting factor, HPF/YfiA family [Vitiosangium sp. GDMCC 1.1324]|uniref:ribosome hibernation-promoting factor, HPF/YfiA family n=1 Tax=Vitiosangium sp. (strain GDMCC 1.1324) TaxID=2138576 RepID=UPI000D3CB455|nr:ribosome-associated translation inhibitor RaiA [Vitiosangium sp. GDMCC 1.1324]PTL78703.1 ribosome-associated translation inhibitor RaiA [Vitiosangium sp. GDMCC 1.1324]
MKVLMRGVHLELSDSLRDYATQHLVEPISKFIDDDEATEIEISLVDVNGPKGGRDQECRVNVRMPGFAGIHITETGETLFQAIDLARDRLENTVKRTVQKRREASSQGLPEDVRS